MNHYLASAFSSSIFIPSMVALVFFRKIDKSYYPFLFCLWLGALNEVLSFILLNSKVYTIVNNNIYVFVESILLTWYFNNKDVPAKRQGSVIICLLLIVFWTSESLVFKTISANSTYFRIFYSMVIVMLSIQLINRTFLECTNNLYLDADFILCCCFIIYFIYKALLQAFIIYGLTRNYAFLEKIYDILYCINLGVNLLYTFAIVCMPRKIRFILPLS